MKHWAYFTAATGLFLLMSLGCESRFVESSPSSVNIQGLSLNERMTQKAAVDARIEEVQRAVETTKHIVETFKKIKNPDTQQDVYTPLDFILEMNRELKARIPENIQHQTLRRTKFQLPIEALSKECQEIEVQLEFNSTADDAGERLTYALKTCGSGEAYRDIMEVQWVSTGLEFRIINKNLVDVFHDIMPKGSLNNSVCKMENDEKNIMEFFRCENFKVGLSPSEYAFVKNMNLKNSGDVRFEFAADIFENDQKKNTAAIKVFANGKVEFVSDKTSKSDKPELSLDTQEIE